MSDKFWRDRFKEAEQVSDPRFSVYQVCKEDWDVIEEKHKEIFRKLNIRDSQLILDVGCGYGRISHFFSPKSYIGIDKSKTLIGYAKILYPDRRFYRMDLLRRLPFMNKSVDWALCVSMKAMIKRECGNEIWDQIEKELLRIAKKVLILEYSTPDDYEIITDNTTK